MNTDQQINVQKVLNTIQQKLKAPKNQFNSFGNYNYRNCEDILEAVKPLLGEAIVTIQDNIVHPEGTNRFYVEAEAKLTLGEESISVKALAREAEVKKGMDEAQITGAASSYARKYALNGLFAIDDTKDPDTKDNTATKAPTVKKIQEPNYEEVPFDDSAPPPTPPSQVKPKKVLGGICPDCGKGKIVKSQKGNNYCSLRCWLQK